MSHKVQLDLPEETRWIRLMYLFCKSANVYKNSEYKYDVDGHFNDLVDVYTPPQQFEEFKSTLNTFMLIVDTTISSQSDLKNIYIPRNFHMRMRHNSNNIFLLQQPSLYDLILSFLTINGVEDYTDFYIEEYESQNVIHIIINFNS